MRLIDQLTLPEDLRVLDAAALRTVAQEIREEIIKTVSTNGGHLGASLGVVELTIALHAELRAPRDKIIWDVGHQAYAHKLLTGRLKDFHTIRRQGGLSGFPCPSESPYDAYGTGHSSTSVSAGVGLAEAARRGAENIGRVVSVIGDGALTGGMAYEGLNQAGHLRSPLLVVLNDNAMAIEPSVGAVSSYLSRLRTDPRLYRLRRDLERRVERLPGIGERMHSVGSKLKDGVKAALVPGMWFEELGFTYIGVIDGHDIETLRFHLRRALSIGGPVLLHCRTVKGKGYPPAERQPGRFHGVAPALPDNGDNGAGPHATTFSRAFGEALVSLARSDERIIGITAAMAGGTGLSLLGKELPGRLYDVGIAEAHAVGFAAGLAAAGMRPVVAIYSTFLQRAYDQVIHDVCLQGLPVVFAVDRAGLVGEDGPTHHGAFDLSFLRCIPGLTILVPKDEVELQRLLATAVISDGPVVIRYPRGEGRGLPLTQTPMPWEGPWVEVLRGGRDLLILATGPVVYTGVATAEILAAQAIEATVAHVSRVRPVDETSLVPLLEGHQAIVTLEENTLVGGFGSSVLEVLHDYGLARTVTRLGLPDRFVGQGDMACLRSDLGLCAGDIAREVQRLLCMGSPVQPARRPN